LFNLGARIDVGNIGYGDILGIQVFNDVSMIFMRIVELGFGYLLHDVADPALAYKAIAVVKLIEKYNVHFGSIK
jgi:hypothetical protein